MTLRAAPVVALHGLGSCRFDVELLAGQLDAPTFTPDALAHGGRPYVEPLDFEAMALDLLVAADSHALDRFSLLGISMGGATALTLASLVPARVARVLVIAPAWLPDGGRPHLGRLQKLGRIILDRGLEQAWRIVRSTPPVSSWSTSDVQAYHKRFLAFDRTAVGQAMMVLPELHPRIDAHVYEAHGIQCDVLGWTNDPIHPVAVAHELAALIGQRPAKVSTRPTDRATEADLICGTWRHADASRPPDGVLPGRAWPDRRGAALWHEARA